MHDILEGETWKPIPTFEKYYEISSLGRVHAIRSNKIMKLDGRNIRLQAEGRNESYMVPVLMACAFKGLDITDPYRNRVLFKDGDSSNIKLDNIYIEDTSDWEGEEWRPIHEAAGQPIKDHYLVSNYGRVKRERHELTWMNYGRLSTKYCPDIIVSQVKTESGYCTCPMTHANGKDMTVQVHRLVAQAFCENNDPEHKIQVNHIDGNPSNNKAINLEWVTPSENALHAIRTGLRSEPHKTLRYPVIREETGVLYNSISDVDRAMGRRVGYCNERLQFNRPCVDVGGNTWTLKILKGSYIKVSGEGQHCTLDEFPGKEFTSLSEASEAIGRYEGYLGECLKNGTTPTSKAGQVIHIRLVGQMPVQIVKRTQEYMKKKAAGLTKPPKERIKSDWAPRKSVKRIETGEIYASLSAASRAMGKDAGYVGECFAYQRDCIDIDGNKWTFEFADGEFKVPYRKNPCYFEELPGVEFNNYTEASQAIGRNDAYVSDRMSQNKPILNKQGQELHLHLINNQ